LNGATVHLRVNAANNAIATVVLPTPLCVPAISMADMVLTIINDYPAGEPA
jgi:hypothetical protein